MRFKKKKKQIVQPVKWTALTLSDQLPVWARHNIELTRQSESTLRTNKMSVVFKLVNKTVQFAVV